MEDYEELINLAGADGHSTLLLQIITMMDIVADRSSCPSDKPVFCGMVNPIRNFPEMSYTQHFVEALSYPLAVLNVQRNLLQLHNLNKK